MSSYAQYTATGAATFTVPCPYISNTHIKVRVNGVLFIMDAHYDIIGGSTVRFRPAFVPATGALVDVMRETPSAPLVAYTNGSVLTATDLNTATLQALYGVEELRDRYERILIGGLTRLTNGTVIDSTTTVDSVVNEVISAAALADLAAIQSDVDANAESLLAHSVTLVNVQDQIDALATIDTTGIAALITSESDARVAGDTAIATTFTLLGAKNVGGTAFEFNLATVMVSPTVSLGMRLSALDATDGYNNARIASEEIVRANADGSLASSISTVSSTVGGHTASIATQQTSINGLNAQYTVKVDVNGHVSGFGLATTSVGATPLSKFTVLADRFEVWNGASAIAPFYVTGGVVYMGSVVIQDARIESLQVGKLIDGGDSPFAPKAWARFYGKSTGAYLTRSKNVASITRYATGKYQVNLAVTMPNTYYLILLTAGASADGSAPLLCGVSNLTTTSFVIAFKNAGGNYRDAAIGSLVVFGSDGADTVPPAASDPTNDPVIGSGGTWIGVIP